MDMNIYTVLLCILLVILIVVLTILGIRLIFLVEKADRLLDNIEKKIKTLDGAFETIEKVNGTVTNIVDTTAYSIMNTISRVFGKNLRYPISEVTTKWLFSFSVDSFSNTASRWILKSGDNAIATEVRKSSIGKSRHSLSYAFKIL